MYQHQTTKHFNIMSKILSLRIPLLKITRTVESVIGVDIDIECPTYLQGRSGGDNFICAIYPNVFLGHDGEQFEEFTFYIRNEEKESRKKFSKSLLEDEKFQPFLENDFKRMVHGEDVLNYLRYGVGLTAISKDNFFHRLKGFRQI